MRPDAAHAPDGERVRSLDPASLRVFAEKGKEGGPGVPQVGDANAVKVRRVLQVTKDLASRPLRDLRVLDVACGEGVYAIEMGLRGTEVVAFDARDERMRQGQACAGTQALSNVTFTLADVRNVGRETLGEFDVVLLLGILYHLDVPDVFRVLESVQRMCREFVVVDTFVSLTDAQEVEHKGTRYVGTRVREHDDGDSPEVRRGRVLRSIDNTFSFRFTRDSLVRLLIDVGFTSVFECLAPREPQKPVDRLTLVAKQGSPVLLSTYPWINGLSDQEIARFLESQGAAGGVGAESRSP